MDNKLSVSFYWHQHQPYYKNSTGVFQMPWVRFHGTKDYLDFLLFLKEFPDIKQNINLVPSLLVQIEDYVKNGSKDVVWLISEKPADKLSTEEKKYIVHNFFMANQTTMIEPYERYYELYKNTEMMKKYLTEDELIGRLSEQDYRDLQIWFNLTWIGIKSREREPLQKLLLKKGNFSEDDKSELFSEILSILSEIIPLHKELWEKGQIDLTTTPFYHPILPLLCDNYIAEEATPDIQLPKIRFTYPEDGEKQIKMAMDYFTEIFGKKPDGMWPAEGSVSDEAVALFAKYSIPYLATDEGILKKSFGGEFDYLDIYRPYQMSSKERKINLFFRDHNLSDAVGFVYSGYKAQEAVTSFLTQLMEIRRKLIAKHGKENLGNFIVSVILDGENCWEYYPNDGKDFISLLFAELSEHQYIKTVRFSEYLKEPRQTETITHIHPGSWINNNFKIWIGAEEDNRSWELLTATRNFLTEEIAKGLHSEEVVREAWEEIYIAEGSDWNWWYGEEHSSAMDLEFDKLYRSHLIRVYELLGADVPGEYFQSIKRKSTTQFKMKYPKNLISPVIDGKWTYYYEWNGAAVYNCADSRLQSTMHQVTKIMKKLYIGFDYENLYFRIDLLSKPSLITEYVINVLTPQKITLVFSPLREVGEAYYWKNDRHHKKVITKDVKMKDILEIGFPFSEVGLKKGEKIGFQIQVKENGHVLEQFPNITLLDLRLPTDDFELREWFV